MKYWVLRDVGPDDGVVVDELPPGSPSNWEYFEHKPLADRFPQDAAIAFSVNYPDGRRLYDFIQNTLRLLIVSPRVREILQPEGDGIEFLPVDILDHQGEPAASGYAILNLLHAQDAIDLEASDYREGIIDQSQIESFDRLALKHAAIDPGVRIFSPRMKADLFIVRDDLLQDLVGSGVTGFKAFEADGWDGMDF